MPSVDFVENISLQLMLSTEDKSRLMELYNISEMGEDVYNRRKQVSKIIHDMANTNMEEPDALTFKTEVDIDSVPEISIYTDKRELRKNLQVLICSDVHNGSDIQVIAQPTEFLTNLLSIAAEGSESAINHLFFFDNTSGEKPPQNTIWIFFRSYVTLHKSMKSMRLFIIMRVRRHISTPRTSCQT